MTFFEFQKRFPTEASALNFIISMKYANGYHCPKCGCIHKGIYGMYHHLLVNYMQRYMDEFCFRLNHRKYDDAFDSLVGLALTA